MLTREPKRRRRIHQVGILPGNPGNTRHRRTLCKEGCQKTCIVLMWNGERSYLIPTRSYPRHTGLLHRLEQWEECGPTKTPANHKQRNSLRRQYQENTIHRNTHHDPRQSRPRSDETCTTIHSQVLYLGQRRWNGLDLLMNECGTPLSCVILWKTASTGNLPNSLFSSSPSTSAPPTVQ